MYAYVGGSFKPDDGRIILIISMEGTFDFMLTKIKWTCNLFYCCIVSND